MIPNRQNLELVFRSLSAEFNNAYGAAKPTWMAIAMMVNSSTLNEEYPWLQNFPKMREWITERQIKQLAAHVYRLRNRDFEATIGIDRNDFDDDRMGAHRTEAAGAGQSAGLWPDEMVYEAVDKSFAALCHDGRPFFADNHPLDNGETFDNLMTEALAADSLAAARGSFGVAETRLMEMKDPEGRPLGLMPKKLLVPPALKATARLLMESDRLGGDDPNPYRGAAEVECSSRLTSRTAWFLTAEGGGGMKPFLWQLRKTPEIDSIMSPNSDHVFKRREYLFGIHGRGEAGYTLPQLAIGSTGTG